MFVALLEGARFPWNSGARSQRIEFSISRNRFPVFGRIYPARPHPCIECRLIKFVPRELRNESSPCRFIPLNEKGQTIDYFHRCGTQLEIEEALAGWLRSEITRIEQQLGKLTDPLLEARVEFSKLAVA